MIQLQELIAADMLKKATMPKIRLEELENSIQTLKNQLPPQVKTHFNRLIQRHPEAIVPVFGNNCSGCGMSLTKSLLLTTRKAEQLTRCPNCTRFLYYPESMVERKRTNRKWGKTRKVGIERFSSPELMLPKLTGTSGDEVLEQLCNRMASAGFVIDGSHLLKMAEQREAIVSTAVDTGLAFPHVRGVEGGGLTMALGIHKKGVKFGGPGRTLTRVFFFMVIPTATSAFYLKLVAGLAKTFRDKTARDQLLAAKTEEELWKALIKTTKKTIK